MKEGLDQITRNKRTVYQGRLGQQDKGVKITVTTVRKKDIAKNGYFQQSRSNRVVSNIIDDIDEEIRGCEDTSVLQSDEDEKFEDVTTAVDVTDEDFGQRSKVPETNRIPRSM